MKNLLCIALLSVAFLVNAAEEKEIVINNFEDITTEFTMCGNEFSDYVMFFGCGSQGNSYYNHLKSLGLSHREARSERRDFVRDCRGNGPNGWLSVRLFGIDFHF